MTLIEGKLFVLIDGTPASFEALTGAAAIAHIFDIPLDVMYLHRPRRRNKPLTAWEVEGWTGQVLRALPPGHAAPPITFIPQNQVASTLNAMATDGGRPRRGVIAVPAAQRRLTRLLASSDHGYERLLREAPFPILSIPPGYRSERIERVLFPIDLAPRSEPYLDEAIAICKRLDAELHLLHVFGKDRLLPGEVDRERRLAAQSPQELLRVDQESILALLDRARSQGIRAISQIAEGRAHTQILNYARAASIDLIVMATHGPRSIEDIVRGSTTIRVIEAAPVAVLAARSLPVAFERRTHDPSSERAVNS